MNTDWILDVLHDLIAFAKQNNMPQLAEHLDDTVLIALSEISNPYENCKTQVDAVNYNKRS